VSDFFAMSSKYLRNDLARQAFMSDMPCSDGMEEQFRRALMEAGILTNLNVDLIIDSEAEDSFSEAGPLTPGLA
jgi:hypothetical protein